MIRWLARRWIHRIHFFSLNPCVVVRRAVFLCLIAGIPGAVPATAQTALSWQDCVQETIAYHPDLESARQALAQSEADKEIAKSAALPSVSASVSARRSGSSSTDTAGTYGYEMSAQQLIFDGLGTAHEIAQAGAGVSAAEFFVFVTASNVRLSLRQAYTQLLTAQAMTGLTQEIFQRREKNLKLVELRYEAGREHKGALMTAEADLEQARFEVEQAQRSLSLCQMVLVKAMGWDVFKPVSVDGDFSTASVSDEAPDFEAMADMTPTLQKLAAQKDAARLGVKSARADFFPEVYLSSSLGRTDHDWPPRDDQWSAGLTVSIPLFEGGNLTGKLSRARASLAQAGADERSGRDTVVVTLQETWTDFQDALGTVVVKKKFLAAADERARIANAQYSSGLISFDDWTIIEDNLVSARKAFLNARASAMSAEALWVQAKGGTLDEI